MQRQSMSGGGTILLRTRVARQVTIARQRFRLALDLHVIRRGPGVPEAIRDRIFLPSFRAVMVAVAWVCRWRKPSCSNTGARSNATVARSDRF